MQEPDIYPPVSLRRLFFKMGGWVVLIFGVIVLILTLAGQAAFVTANRFDAEGVETFAVVKERYFTQKRDSDGDLKTTYWLELDFITERGEDFSLSRKVGRKIYNRAREGEEIEIRYLASQPSVTEVSAGSNRVAANVMRIIMVFIGALWLALLWIVGRWVVEAGRARAYGEMRDAQVTEVFKTSIRINNRPRYRIRWRDDQGQTGQSLLRKAREVEGFAKGDTIRVYQGLKRSWWAGDIGDRSAAQ